MAQNHCGGLELGTKKVPQYAIEQWSLISRPTTLFKAPPPTTSTK